MHNYPYCIYSGDAHRYEAIGTDRISWSIIAVPSRKWADKVFPHLPEEERVSALWEKIFKAIRINLEDPIEEWRYHVNGLKQEAEQLNNMSIRELHYKATGTHRTS